MVGMRNLTLSLEQIDYNDDSKRQLKKTIKDISKV